MLSISVISAGNSSCIALTSGSPSARARNPSAAPSPAGPSPSPGSAAVAPTSDSPDPGASRGGSCPSCACTATTVSRRPTICDGQRLDPLPLLLQLRCRSAPVRREGEGQAVPFQIDPSRRGHDHAMEHLVGLLDLLQQRLLHVHSRRTRRRGNGNRSARPRPARRATGRESNGGPAPARVLPTGREPDEGPASVRVLPTRWGSNAVSAPVRVLPTGRESDGGPASVRVLPTRRGSNAVSAPAGIPAAAKPPLPWCVPENPVPAVGRPAARASSGESSGAAPSRGGSVAALRF